MGHRIAIIGSGATAHAAAATFSLQGNSVALADLPQYGDALGSVMDRGGILLRGNGLVGFAKPDLVTTDVPSATRDADAVIISVVAGRHEEIARAIAGTLSAGQVVAIAPGNAGSLIFDRALKAKASGAIIGEIQGNLFPCRLTGPAEVLAGGGLRKKRFAAYPAKRTPDAIRSLDGILELEAARHVFEVALNSPNVIIHLISAALNASKIEDMGEDFSLFIHGLTPGVLRAVDAAWLEWRAVMDALGYWQMDSPAEYLRLVADRGARPELDVFRSLKGPDSLRHRYVSEDAPCGVSLLVSLAKAAGVEVPLTMAALTLFSVINGVDYYAQGRTLENFGLAGRSPSEIDRLLIDGAD
ncbi:MAG: NAD/NADP octopine/nopaline dehydrogenase family protein [Synergistaceae bacterium]|jgi:opine dehydrogenase|nr:NAD/NADP octopine/nopaline dehydrogenase family protein [Synergistaceae bacterium]